MLIVISGFICAYNLCFLGRDLTYSLPKSIKEQKMPVSVNLFIYINANIYKQFYLCICTSHIT